MSNTSKLAKIRSAKATLSVGDCVLIGSGYGESQSLTKPIGVKPDRGTFSWPLVGEAGGQTKPEVTVAYKYEYPKPGNGNETAYGPWIKVHESEASEGSISGSVFDLDTGAPIREARAVLSPDGMQVTTTADGTYSFVDVIPGAYEMNVHARGYVSAGCTLEVKPGVNTSVDALHLRHCPYVGNRASQELHVISCKWVGLMNRRNQLYFDEMDEALSNGYNGCRFCLPEHDTG